MTKKIPSESVQISAQIFAMELAKNLSEKTGIGLREAAKIAAKETRVCMDYLGLTSPKDTP